jgi:hypothetical protein
VKRKIMDTVNGTKARAVAAVSWRLRPCFFLGLEGSYLSFFHKAYQVQRFEGSYGLVFHLVVVRQVDGIAERIGRGAILVHKVGEWKEEVFMLG